LRFSGSHKLYGASFSKLQQARILVIGLGGVGSFAAEALARSGVLNIDLLDLDEICLTNTNRQIHTLTANIGRSKAQVMSERILQINPNCRTQIHLDFLDQQNLATYVTSEIDAVIDCIDSVRVKAALIAWCKRRKIKIITCGGAGGKISPTQIQIKDLSKAFNDPLSAKVRATLRHDYNFSRDLKCNFGVPCVFSSEQIRYTDACGGVTFAKNGVQSGINCSGGLGSSCMVTASFGLAAAAWVVNKLTLSVKK